jgi:hypothetical protein
MGGSSHDGWFVAPWPGETPGGNTLTNMLHPGRCKHVASGVLRLRYRHLVIVPSVHNASLKIGGQQTEDRAANRRSSGKQKIERQTKDRAANKRSNGKEKIERQRAARQ